MAGKVFSDSVNIYQDQAKILFDYYKAAAEKIVSEELSLENAAKDLQQTLAEAQQEQKKTKTIFPIALGAAGVFLIIGFFLPFAFILTAVGLFFGIKYFISNKKILGDIERITNEIQQLGAQHQAIRRDYAVEKLGVVYVPVATRIPFDEKSFLIDHTNTVKETEFQLNVLNQPENFQQSMDSLKKSMENVPVIENNNMPESVDTSDYSTSVQNVVLHDYVGNIDRQVRNINYLLNDSENVSVSMPVIIPDSEYANVISEYATNEVNEEPIVNVFDVNFGNKLDKFSRLNQLKNQMNEQADGDNTAYMSKMMAQLAECVDLLSKTKNAGSSKLIDYTSQIFSTVLKAGYTQYSPQLEAEEIEKVRLTEFDYQASVNEYTPFTMKKSSQVQFDMFSGNWVAEDGSRTSMPFGMHQIDEEILVPIISSLMEENRIERLRVYNNIEDQKREYLDKWNSEIGNYFRDNRKSADELITNMRKTYADYISAYNMYQNIDNTTVKMKASKSIEDAEVQEIDLQDEMIAGFEIQAQQCNEEQERFAEFMDRIQDNISDSTNQFAHIEYYEGSLRDIAPHETAVAMSNIHELDSRRKSLLGVSPYLATYGELPPEPRTAPEMMEHVKINLTKEVQQEMETINNNKNNGMSDNTMYEVSAGTES